MNKVGYIFLMNSFFAHAEVVCMKHVDHNKWSKHIIIQTKDGIIQGDTDGLAQEILADKTTSSIDLSECTFGFYEEIVSNIKFKGAVGAKKLKMDRVSFGPLIDMNNITFDHCSLKQAVFSGCNLNDVLFKWTNMSGATFFSTTITGGKSSFFGVIANGANFTSTQFQDTTLSLVNFSDANLAKSIWNNVVIDQFSNVQGASFISSTGQSLVIGGSNIGDYVNVERANFSSSGIKNIAFKSYDARYPTNLTAAKFTDTTFDNVNFVNVQIKPGCINRGGGGKELLTNVNEGTCP